MTTVSSVTATVSPPISWCPGPSRACRSAGSDARKAPRPSPDSGRPDCGPADSRGCGTPDGRLPRPFGPGPSTGAASRAYSKALINPCSFMRANAAANRQGVRTALIRDEASMPRRRRPPRPVAMLRCSITDPGKMTPFGHGPWPALRCPVPRPHGTMPHGLGPETPQLAEDGYCVIADALPPDLLDDDPDPRRRNRRRDSGRPPRAQPLAGQPGPGRRPSRFRGPDRQPAGGRHLRRPGVSRSALQFRLCHLQAAAQPGPVLAPGLVGLGRSDLLPGHRSRRCSCSIT